MPSLTIHDLPDDVHAALQARAAKAGRSVEAEARGLIAAGAPVDTLLERAKAARERIQAVIREANGGVLPTGLDDDFIADRRAEAAREWAEAGWTSEDRP